MTNDRRGTRPAGRGITRSRDRTSEWTDPEAVRHRALRRCAVGSALVHGVVLAVLCWAPAPRAKPVLPGVVSVDLVALAGGPTAPAPAAAPAKPAPQPSARAEAPKPLPEPPAEAAAQPAAKVPPEPARKEPPRPRPPTREAVLPKEPRHPSEAKKPKPRPAKEPKPEPPEVAAKPAPARKPTPPEPPKPKPRPQESYEDVLAELRRERGESRPGQAARAAPPGAPGSAGLGQTGSAGLGQTGSAGPGRPMDAEIAAWLRAAQYHVEQAWVLPPGFQREALLAVVSVRLDAEGRVREEPRIVRRSGNPWYDESVVRAIQKASPLPPPPEAGDWQFEFRPPRGGGTG